MFNWRNELKALDTEVAEMVTSYIIDKIPNMSVSESGQTTIVGLIKKFNLADILESIDISAVKYLKYEIDNVPTQESAREFFAKIGGILVNKNRPLIDQRLSYVKGICKNRFHYWSPQAGSILLKDYIAALRNKGWSEERIVDDINNEIIPETKTTKNWTEWKNLILNTSFRNQTCFNLYWARI